MLIYSRPSSDARTDRSLMRKSVSFLTNTKEVCFTRFSETSPNASVWKMNYVRLWSAFPLRPKQRNSVFGIGWFKKTVWFGMIGCMPFMASAKMILPTPTLFGPKPCIQMTGNGLTKKFRMRLWGCLNFKPSFASFGPTSRFATSWRSDESYEMKTVAHCG